MGVGSRVTKTLMELEPGDCRFPDSDEFCGHASQLGSSYCPPHHRRAYRGGRRAEGGMVAYIHRADGTIPHVAQVERTQRLDEVYR